MVSSAWEIGPIVPLQGPERPESLPVPFESGVEPPPAPTPCSHNECLAGHRWPAILALATCPGCTTPILAVQKTQCPYCNEPIQRTILRSDFVPRGTGIAPRCKGVSPMGESLDIEMTRKGWQEAEASTEPFLVREAKERQKETQSK